MKDRIVVIGASLDGIGALAIERRTGGRLVRRTAARRPGSAPMRMAAAVGDP